jgi:hypothetical protein
MIQIIYRWEVPVEHQAAFVAPWEKTTVNIRKTTKGARGSFCIVNVDRSTEILTVAKWDELHQWREFVKGAKLTSMREMHLLGTLVSHDAYEQKGNFTL